MLTLSSRKQAPRDHRLAMHQYGKSEIRTNDYRIQSGEKSKSKSSWNTKPGGIGDSSSRFRVEPPSEFKISSGMVRERVTPDIGKHKRRNDTVHDRLNSDGLYRRGKGEKREASEYRKSSSNMQV